MKKKVVCIECKHIEKPVRIGDAFTIIDQPVMFHCRYRDICKFCKEDDYPFGVYKTRKFSECKTYLRYCKKFGDEVDFEMPKITFKVDVVQ